ncbi:hypothetical protein BUALT_Bualt16G0051000 [Buddleja alternifolia]|uniref:Serine aminopeptidase S33 domain-containing protein n=1 Tax=Buddleja alternifolia TaxID=168488 RepID=A0AAV6WJU7_9LAMI|nr:hypothetical protein BUALT_Bualt16G0051000 [Buddleja alternifolia]
MQQKIKIEKKDGEILVGMLHETGSDGIVIMCHGFLCTKDQPIIVNLAVALENAGISVFRFDFTGNGESDGSFQFSNYYKEVEDIRAVTEYFGVLNRKIIAILGHSKGASIVLLYASKYHDVDAVINVSGPYHLDRGIEVRLGANFMDRIEINGFIDFTNKGEIIYFLSKINKGKVHRVTKESLMEQLNTNMHDICLSIDKRCRFTSMLISFT